MDFMNSPYEDYTTEELDAKEKQLMYELELNKLKRKALDEQAYFLELKLSMIIRRHQEKIRNSCRVIWLRSSKGIEPWRNLRLFIF